MMIRYTFTLCLYSVFIFAVACSSPKDPDAVLKEIFNAQEMVVVNQIIDYYDAYVWSQTDPSLPIEKAYQQFFNKNCLNDSTAWNLFPPMDQVTVFFESLDQESLQYLFRRDSLFYYSNATDELIRTEPYLYRLQPAFRYLKLLKILAEKDPFYEIYYDRVETIGGISPGLWAMIFYSYPKNNPEGVYLETKANFNFNKKEERFTSIIPFLNLDRRVEAPEGMYIRYARKQDWNEY